MVKVSVIVPIYNVEQYLEQCLDSLCGQTLKEIEIILVNDASPDHSDRIMERYREKYDNIKTVYLSENRCLGGARNAGIEIATGKYLCFVDSDDWIDSDYLEKMYLACEETGSDLAYSVYKTMTEDAKEINERLIWPKEISGELTIEKKRALLGKGVFAWGKLYSLALWKEIGLTYPEHIKYEDAPTTPIYILHAKKCCLVMDTYYRYRTREASITHARNTGHDDAQKTALLFVSRMKEYGFYEEYLPEIEHFMVNFYYCTFLRRCVTLYDEIPYDVMEETKCAIRNWFPDYEKNPYHFIFLAEDRMRMMMNELSPYVCALWERKYKDEMAKDEEFYSEIYLPFYEEKKDIVKKIVEGCTKKVGFFGDRHKRKALSRLFEKYFPAVYFMEFETEQELYAYDLNELDMVIGVNPSACLPLHKIKQERQYDMKVINLEDTLLGYLVEV